VAGEAEDGRRDDCADDEYAIADGTASAATVMAATTSRFARRGQ
jgi:hypothetical protein